MRRQEREPLAAILGRGTEIGGPRHRRPADPAQGAPRPAGGAGAPGRGPGLPPLGVLVVVGDGEEDRCALREQARVLALAGRVHWLGHREDAPRLMQAFDLLTLPSTMETMPLTLLEGMAAGLADRGERHLRHSRAGRERRDRMARAPGRRAGAARAPARAPARSAAQRAAMGAAARRRYERDSPSTAWSAGPPRPALGTAGAAGDLVGAGAASTGTSGVRAG